MTPEQIALNMESVLYQTSSRLTAPDMRDQSFEQQLDNIIATISAQRADQEFTTKKIKEQQLDITDLQQKIASLEGQSRQQKERLMAEEQLNRLFSEVRDYFEDSIIELMNITKRFEAEINVMKPC